MAAGINLISHVRRQEGSTEGLGALIPKEEGRKTESSGILRTLPHPQSPGIPKSASVTELWLPKQEKITVLKEMCMRWELHDTQQTCQIKTITNQMKAMLKKKCLFVVLIKLYSPLLPLTPRKWTSKELIKLNDLLKEILLMKIFWTFWSLWKLTVLAEAVI